MINGHNIMVTPFQNAKPIRIGLLLLFYASFVVRQKSGGGRKSNKSVFGVLVVQKQDEKKTK